MRLSRILDGRNWKYAVGEVALIVVGVTIALWADAWVTAKGEHAREAARLNALYQDTTETLDALDTAHQNALGATEALQEILALKPPFGPTDDLYVMLRYGLLYGPTFHPEMSVYEDLMNSGELALLTNPELRQALSRLDVGLEQLRSAQADVTTVQQLNVDSYMVDHVDLRFVYGQSTGFADPDNKVDTDFSFITDTAFQNRILLKLDVVTQLEIELKDAESRLLTVKRFIESDLEL